MQKDPIYLEADGDVVAVFSDIDADDHHLNSRVRLSTATLNMDLAGEILTVPGAGEMLIEDYRVKTPAASAVASSAARSPFDTGGLPSQSFIAWESYMGYNLNLRHAEFEENVRVDHRTGAKMILAAQLIGSAAEGIDPQDAPGRRTQLTCRTVVIEFGHAAGDRLGKGDGLGSVSARDIRQLYASGDVRIVDDEFSVDADHITKHADSSLLTVSGDATRDAEIQTQGNIIHARRIYYDLFTRRVEVADLRATLRQ